MKREKPLALLLTEFWWAKTDIMRLFDTSWQAAEAIYFRARDVDEREGIVFEPKKARQKSVLKVTGYTYTELERNIKMRLLEQPHSE